MFTAIFKWISLLVLLIAPLFTPFSGSLEPLFNALICAGASAVVIRMFRAGEPFWAAGFVAAAVLCSPLLLVFKIVALLTSACVVMFVTLLEVLKMQLAPVENTR